MYKPSKEPNFAENSVMHETLIPSHKVDDEAKLKDVVLSVQDS